MTIQKLVLLAVAHIFISSQCFEISYIAFSENRQTLGEVDGIDVLLQQLAVSFLTHLLKVHLS